MYSKTDVVREVSVKGRLLSKNNFTVIAGPCTVESKSQLMNTAQKISELGIFWLRGGAYKMRTSPDHFQGLGMEGLEMMKEVCSSLNMISVSEITSISELSLMKGYIDVFLVGTRNMHNYPLLSALGENDTPVILKRGMASTIKEWILAAEYIAKGGNGNIILCERGIRTFEPYTRNTLDLSAIPAIKQESDYPVLVDPSHSTGRSEMVKAMSWAAAAAGADGLLIECDTDPDSVKCDARQTINIDQLHEIVAGLPQLLKLWGKQASS